MATLTITTTAAQDARIVVAFGKRLGLERNATSAEVKAAVIDYIKQIVFDQEAAAARQTAQAGITEITPT